jgi:hypothetical protein
MTADSQAREYQSVALGRIWLRLSVLPAVHPPQLPFRRNRLAGGVAPAYIGAIENGPAVRTRRAKMISAFGRTSENVLFSLLIVALFGWTAASVAADASVPAKSAQQCVAKIAAAIRHS